MKLAMWSLRPSCLILAVLILSGCGGITFAPPDPGAQYMLDRQQDQLQAQMRYNQERNDYMAQQYLQPRHNCFQAGTFFSCN